MIEKETAPSKPQGEIRQHEFDPRNDPRVAGLKCGDHDLLEYYSVVDRSSYKWALSYGVRRHTPPAEPDGAKHAAVYEAFTPYRQVTYIGQTREEAISCMLFGVAELARNGSFNPDDPMAKGSPPIQHAMEVLQERLQWHLARRKEYLEELSQDVVTALAGLSANTNFCRHNEAVTSLSTAIAALGRVKDL